MNLVNPEIGDFCCVPVSGPVGKLISFGEWLNGDGFSRYDHAEIYVGNPIGGYARYGYTFSAYPDGATYKPLDDETRKNALWSTGHFDLTVNQRNNIVEICKSLEGTPYSVLDYFALAEHRFHFPVPFLKDYVSSTKHMICSQLVDLVYKESGVYLFNDGRWPGYVTPADLASLLGG